MSAAELRKAAETWREEWAEADPGDTTEELACALALIDLLHESADFYNGLPPTVAARLLTFTRLVEGGAA